MSNRKFWEVVNWVNFCLEEHHMNSISSNCSLRWKNCTENIKNLRLELSMSQLNAPVRAPLDSQAFYCPTKCKLWGKQEHCNSQFYICSTQCSMLLQCILLKWDSAFKQCCCKIRLKTLSKFLLYHKCNLGQLKWTSTIFKETIPRKSDPLETGKEAEIWRISWFEL